MAIAQRQAGRLAVIKTQLGADALLLTGLEAVERLSTPFEFTIDVLSQAGEIDFEPLLGTAVEVEVSGTHAEYGRIFHGMLCEAEALDQNQEGVGYRLIVRPWTALLAATQNARIFQNLSVVDIVEKVFVQAGFNAFETKDLVRAYKSREYCVQFRESDLDFVSRLMEEEGIYYYFRHEAGAHTLVLADSLNAHPKFEHGAIPVYPYEGAALGPRFWKWREKIRFAPAKVALSDHHFLTPDAPKRAELKASSAHALDEFEIYDAEAGQTRFGADAGQDEGPRYAEDRLQALRAERRVFAGEGDVFSVATGVLVEVGEAPQCLTVATRHRVVIEAYRSVGEAREQAPDGKEKIELEVVVEATPSATPWRAPQTTRKPRAYGPQTALVVGTGGAVIHTDEHGRIKVQFHWDRLGKKDDDSSCWIRVSQGWADAGFGAIHIPRVGEEVVVDFIDGDLDRPIVTGRVFNAKQKPPYALPANKTRSSWKSQTVGEAGSYPEAEEPPAASGKGYNELRFEDLGGSEEVYLHAQRDLNAWVRFDETHKTGRDATERVGRDKKVGVKRHLATTLDDGDETRTVTTGKRTTTIKGDDSLTLQQGDQITTVQAGNYSLKVSAGKASLEAAQEILLKVGGSSIKLTPTGIEIHAMTVKVKADVALQAEGGVTTDVKAGMKMTVNGAIVMIN